MINVFLRTQTPFRYVLADTWFASAENMAFIKLKKGKEFVFPLKSNRKVVLSWDDQKHKRFVSVDSVTFDDDTSCLTVYLEQVEFPLRLIRSSVTNDSGKTSGLHLVASDLTLSGADMVRLYRKRWKIEEFHKSIKSHASFAKSPTRRVRTQSNHFFASLIAFVTLETYRTNLSLNHFALRTKIYQAALASAFQQLQIFKVACPDAAITL